MRDADERPRCSLVAGTSRRDLGPDIWPANLPSARLTHPAACAEYWESNCSRLLLDPPPEVTRAGQVDEPHSGIPMPRYDVRVLQL